MEEALTDAMYGGAIGALLGGALMVLSDGSGNDWSYVATGASVGVLAGAAYGLSRGVTSTASAAEYEDGKWAFRIPSFQTFEDLDLKTNVTEYIGKISLFGVKF